MIKKYIAILLMISLTGCSQRAYYIEYNTIEFQTSTEFKKSEYLEYTGEDIQINIDSKEGLSQIYIQYNKPVDITQSTVKDKVVPEIFVKYLTSKVDFTEELRQYLHENVISKLSDFNTKKLYENYSVFSINSIQDKDKNQYISLVLIDNSNLALFICEVDNITHLITSVHTYQTNKN